MHVLFGTNISCRSLFSLWATSWFYTITSGFNLSETLKVLRTFYMLHLVGGSSISTKLLTPFEHSCPVSTAMLWAIVWRSYTCCDTYV